MNKFQLFLTALLITTTPYLLRLDFPRVLAYLFMGLALSSTSLIVYYRRSELLASECVHIGLFSVTLGYILEYLFNVPTLMTALLTGLTMVYLTGLLVKTGFSIEKASAILVSFTTAVSVLVIHYALTNVPARYSLSAIILGDPLLLTRSDSLIAISISSLITIIVVLFFKEIVNVSIDPVSASVVGIKTSFYDFLSYTIIGVSTIGLLRLAGYVMEHVLVIMPAIVSSMYSHSLRDHVLNTALIGVAVSALGYLLAVFVDTSPTGLTGLLLVLLMVIGYLVRKT